MDRLKPAQWEQFFERLQPMHDRARASARRLSRAAADGDDLFQEAVLRAFDKFAGLRDPERFGAWFYMVLLSVHRSRSRRRFWQRFVPVEVLIASGREPATHDTADLEEERMRARRMSVALGKLPAVQREAIVLHDLDGFTLEEIASLQRVTLSGVKTRVSRGRDALRRHYERLGLGRAARGDSAPLGREATPVGLIHGG